MLAGVHRFRRPLTCYGLKLNWLILPVVSTFLIKVFTASTVQRLSTVQKHLAQACMSITLGDSQTFHQLSIFNGKTHYFQTCKYDASMASPVAMKISFYVSGTPNCSKHFLWTLYKPNHFPWRYRKKCEWFFLWTQCIQPNFWVKDLNSFPRWWPMGKQFSKWQLSSIFPSKWHLMLKKFLFIETKFAEDIWSQGWDTVLWRFSQRQLLSS